MIGVWVVAALAAGTIQLAAADKFSCEGRASGYYADVDTGCQVYHMCDGLGRQFSYSCPNTTLFQQRMLICDHWYMVNCSKSELDYNANLLIGQRDKPFVEDSSEHPYHRTPRPDLLQQPYAPRYQDEDYRQGRAYALSSSLNLVGVATDEVDENGNPKTNYTTDRPQYFLPSHWSTQYGKGLTTPLPPIKINNKSNKQNYDTGGKSSTGDRKLPPPNFNYDPKSYKATKNTPPPVQKNTNSVPKNNSARKTPPQLPKIQIVPPSIPKIPVIPSHLPKNPVPLPKLPTIPIPSPPKPVLPPLPFSKNNQINKFATINRQDTGNIPDAINEASVSPSSLALPPFAPKIERNDDRPPQVQKGPIDNIPKPSIYYQPPKISSTFDFESTTMDPQTFYKLIPSKVLLPPVQQSRTVEGRSSTVLPTKPATRTSTTPKTVNKKDTEQNKDTTDSENRWKELRQMFFIPEYDFPLEVASRPSYEGGLSSFQVNSGPPNPEIPRRNNSGSSGSAGPNPDCPKCDPAFLAPGTCKPCVMIRR